jgi:hypothetical protein
MAARLPQPCTPGIRPCAFLERLKFQSTGFLRLDCFSLRDIFSG